MSEGPTTIPGEALAAEADDAHVAKTTCPDCGSPAEGHFCSACGQELHVHRTLFHLGHELLHGVMHFDGRFWRTLPLLVKNPGRLTREWIAGRRTRYVSPLAMFLCTLFVMFMALSFAPYPDRMDVQVQLPDQIELQRGLVSVAQTNLSEGRAAVAAAEPGKPVLDSDGDAINIVELEQKVTERQARLTKLEDEAKNGRADGLKPSSWQAQLADLKFDDANKKNSLSASVAKKLKNPDLALYKLQQTTYKFAFLLVPFSVPFMALLFLWRRKVTLYDHSVFVLYSLTFMSLLLMVAVVAGTLITGSGAYIVALCSLIIPVHIFAQLKGSYGLGIWGALWRTMVLGIFCTMVISFFVIAIIYLGLGH